MCSSCRRLNDARARFCGTCGTKLSVNDARDGGTQSVEEPVNSRNAVQATLEERKVVTVLFVDIIESLAAIRHFDPEEAHELLTPVLGLMSDAVHAFGGVVTRALGDGLMAIFGAPSAQEDHALRACRTALHMLDALSKGQATEKKIRVRIGIHSGEVAVGSLTTDFAVDYEVTGVTVAIASRVQSAAPLGRAAMTVKTMALVRDDVVATSLGMTNVKGLEESIELFVIERLSVESRNWTESSAEKLLGRTTALGLLQDAFRLATKGSGRVLAVVGEAGIGKTALIECFVSMEGPNAKVVRSSSDRYSGMVPFHPFRQIVVDLFNLSELGIERRKAKINRLAGRSKGERLTAAAPLLELLETGGGPPEWETLDPLARRSLIASAVIQELLKESQKRPLIVVIEDVQRTDSATIELIGSLTDAISQHRILIIVSSRPDFARPWANNRNYEEVRLNRLSNLDTERLLEQLVGDAILPQLQRRLLSWSGGNPLFLRESVRALVDARVLGGEPGSRVLLTEVGNIEPPASITAIISERVDRLPSETKQILLAASVLGEQFPIQTLARVNALPEELVWPHLGTLEAAEFVKPATLERTDTFTFCHALFYEVCYATLLKSRRQELHSIAFSVLMSEASGNFAPPVERLAHHAFNGQLWNEAFMYCRAAGQRAAARSSNLEAVVHLENAIAALGRIDPTRQRLREAIELRLELREARLTLLQLQKVGALLAETYDLAQQLNDPSILAKIVGFMSGQAYITESPSACVELSSKAQKLARVAKDRTLEIAPNIFLGQAQYAFGHYRRAVATFQRNVRLIDRLASHGSLGLLGRPLVVSRYWIAISKAELGMFREAENIAREMISDRRELLPFDLAYAKLSLGFVLTTQGRYEEALNATNEALEYANRYDIRFIVHVVASQAGWLLATQGQVSQGLKLTRQGFQAAESIGVNAGRSRWFARLSEVCLIAGRIAEARQHAEKAVEIAEKAGELGYLSSALRLRGMIESQSGSEYGDALADIKQAVRIAHKLAVGPLLAKCLVDLGRVERLLGRPHVAQRWLSEAAARFKHYEMRTWELRAERELGNLAASQSGAGSVVQHPSRGSKLLTR